MRSFDEKEEIRIRSIWGNCEEKHDSIWSAVMIFFVMSLAGWLWEVGFHWIRNGSFVNRGFLHGPWLPIYGSGSVLVLVLLNRLRKKPLLEFLAIVILCGVIEYCVSWILEQLYDGTKWWDYSECFGNLNGRICAGGLLAFGVGGMLLVYFLAPLLDNLFRRIPKKIRMTICLILLLLFCMDLLYSGKHPNMGNGITKPGGERLCLLFICHRFIL